jgi:hypothetical protein
LVASLIQIRDGAAQRKYLSSVSVTPSADLVIALSVKIRELCSGKDPALAEVLADTTPVSTSLKS